MSIGNINTNNPMGGGVLSCGIVDYDTISISGGGSSSSSGNALESYTPQWKTLCTLGGDLDKYNRAVNSLKIANAIFSSTSWDSTGANVALCGKGRAIPVQLAMRNGSGLYNLDIIAIIDLSNLYDVFVSTAARGTLQIHYLIMDITQ